MIIGGFRLSHTYYKKVTEAADLGTASATVGPSVLLTRDLRRETSTRRV